MRCPIPVTQTKESIFWWLLFLILATIFLTWYNQYFIVSDTLYYNTYGEKLSLETIATIIENTKKYAWISYILAPMTVILRILFTAVCLYTGSFFRNRTVEFTACYKAALYSDTIFLTGGLIHIILLLFLPPESIQDLSGNPFSLLYYLDIENIPHYLLYPAGLLNVYEIAYWVVLALWIQKLQKSSFVESIYFVLSTYGLGLLLIALVFTLILI